MANFLFVCFVYGGCKAFAYKVVCEGRVKAIGRRLPSLDKFVEVLEIYERICEFMIRLMFVGEISRMKLWCRRGT